MASVLRLLNRLLPFATPGTPLIQDLIHLASICTILYFAPQIQEWVRARQQNRAVQTDGEDEHEEDNAPRNPADEVEQDERPIVNENLQQDNAQPDIPQQPHDPQPARQEFLDEGQPGPANAAEIAAQRNVGAKKAKSLARKDQRRAFHEFQRSQGEAQRARDAEGAAEREDVLAKERARRKAAEDEIEAKKAKEREQRREQERRQREAENQRREMVVEIVRTELEARRTCDLFKVAKQLGDDVDEEWIEKILKASNLLGRKEDVVTMITGNGWAVRVSERDMRWVYEQALEPAKAKGEDGLGLDNLGPLLEKRLKASLP